MTRVAAAGRQAAARIATCPRPHVIAADSGKQCPPAVALELLVAAAPRESPPNAGADAAPNAGAPPRLKAGAEVAPNRPPAGVAPPKVGAAAGAADLAAGAAGAAAAAGFAAPARLNGGSSSTGVGAAAAGLAGGEGAATAAGRARALAVVTRTPPPSPWQRCSSCCCSCCQRPEAPPIPGEEPAAGEARARGERRGWLTGVWLLLPRRWEAGDSATSCQGDLHTTGRRAGCVWCVPPELEYQLKVGAVVCSPKGCQLSCGSNPQRLAAN